MALAATGVWEIRANGSALNGGYFDQSLAGAGTDYSQQNAAQLSLTDVASDVAGTTLTSATGGFTAAMVGNALWNTGAGTSTDGFYVVTTFISSNSVTIDRTIGSSKSGLSIKVGGAQTLNATMAAASVKGNQTHIKADATHTLADNVTLTSDINTGSTVTGYSVSRGDSPTGTSRPLIACGAYTFYLTYSCHAYHLRLTGSGSSIVWMRDAAMAENCSATASGGTPTGFRNQTIYNLGVSAFRCQAVSCTTGFWFEGVPTLAVGCVTTACGTGFLAYNGMSCVSCIARTGTTGFSFGGSGVAVNCTCYGCTTGVSQANAQYAALVDCVLDTCTTGDYSDSSAVGRKAVRRSNNFNANGTPRTNVAVGYGDTAVDPGFAAPASGNFYPGAALRATGFPGDFGDGINVGYLDQGAVQRSEIGGVVGFPTDITYHLLADFGKSPYVDTGNTGINAPAGYETRIPSLVVGDSFELILDCWEDYAASGGTRANFGGCAAATLYLKRLNSAENPITLATTTPETDGVGAEYNRIRFIVPSATITSVYANQRCLLYAVVTGTQDQRTLMQETDVIDADGTGASDLETKNVPVSMTPKTTSGTLTAYPGYVAYQASGTISLTLPDADDEDQQEIVIVNIGSGAITVVGTINGDAGGLVLSRQYDSCRLISDGTSWYNENLTTIVR